MSASSNPLVPEAVDVAAAAMIATHLFFATTVIAVLLIFPARTRLSFAQLFALLLPLLGPLALAVILGQQLRQSRRQKKLV